MRLWVYVVRRVVVVIPVVLGVMTVLFILVSALPATERACSFYHPVGSFSPCTNTIPCPSDPSRNCPNPVYQSAVRALGLNQPIYVQWAIFVGNEVTFQWGYVALTSSLGVGCGEAGCGPQFAGQSVTSVLGEALPYSVELLLVTFAITFLVALPVLNRAVAQPRGASDRAARALMISGYALPPFIVGSILLVLAVTLGGGPAAPSSICGSSSTAFLDFFGSWPQPPCTALYGTTNIGPIGYPNWLPYGLHSSPTGFPTIDSLLHGDGWLALDTLFRMLLPALCLSLVAIAAVFRFARPTPVARAELELVRAARARGLPESTVASQYVTAHNLNSTLSTLRPALVAVIGMLPVVEIVFNLWGVGRFFAAAVVGVAGNYDLGILFGSLLLFSLMVLGVWLAADIVHAYRDPRFRIGTDSGIGDSPRIGTYPEMPTRALPVRERS